jgi:hypothetical protein
MSVVTLLFLVDMLACLGGDQKRLSFHGSQFAILQIMDQHPKECHIGHICDCSFLMNSFSDKVVAVLSAGRARAFNNYSLLDCYHSFVVDNNQYPEIIITFKSCTK